MLSTWKVWKGMKNEVAFRSFAKNSRVEIFFSGRDSASAVKNSSKNKRKEEGEGSARTVHLLV